MAKVTFQGVIKRYNDRDPHPVVAVDKMNLVVEDREFMVIVGPSGCGKSTTLRMIAGLEDVSEGSITFDHKEMNLMPPGDRGIAMVFQNYALYPHLSVYKNMAFGLNLLKLPKEKIDRRVQDAAQILGISDLLDRKPAQLSGGQRQRVALGRAIARKPKVFLLDEPLSNLDAKLRSSMRIEISKLHTRLGTTMIYVTHDQTEAMTMGDRITVMNKGKIMQIADPLTLYNQPANMFVAGFIGNPPMNFLHGKIESRFDALCFIEESLSDTRLVIPLNDHLAQQASPFRDQAIVFGIRPEGIRVKDNTLVSPHIQPAEALVEVVEPMGHEFYIYLSSGAQSFIARSRRALRYSVNEPIPIFFDLDQAHLFDPKTEAVL